MIKSILLPVDGSVFTEAQVKHCIQLAKAFKATVNVLAVVDIRIIEWAAVMGTDGFVPVTPSTIYKQESKKILEEKADAVLQKCADIFERAGVVFELEKIPGSPVDVICEKMHLVDLLVIGLRGEFAKWRQKLVGATLYAVVREWEKPILVTKQKHQKFTTILFAYDGSHKANKALQMAGFWAATLKLPLKVLSVHVKESLRNRVLQEAGAYLKPFGIDVELIGVAGNPEKQIARFSDEKQCDLIIMGAFGHSRIREAILGSTTEQVMRNPKIPVLLSK